MGNRRVLIPGAVVLGLLVTALAIGSRTPENPVPPAAGSRCRAGSAVVLAGAPRDLAQNRCDQDAASGPWTVVVRHTGGSLAHRGAVITFPVEAGPQEGAVVWGLAGAYARIRGDLAAADLDGLARRVTVVSGRPHLVPPSGYVVVFTGPYRAPVVQEAGYGSDETALGPGWVHTGIVPGGGFEDALYAAGARPAAAVNGQATVLSGVREGDGLLCWELTPGRIAFVAYGGGRPRDALAEAALHRLAQRTRVRTAIEWQATDPVVIGQINDDRNPGPWPVRSSSR